MKKLVVLGQWRSLLLSKNSTGFAAHNLTIFYLYIIVTAHTGDNGSILLHCRSFTRLLIHKFTHDELAIQKYFYFHSAFRVIQR